MKQIRRSLFAILAFLLCSPSWAQTYDLVIRHGRVVDGSGNPAFFGDVAIKDGRITEIGRISGEAKAEIEAKGLVVAPGFIDVHTHADEVADMPRAENFVRMGVTTVVVGNCGGSTLNVAKFFREIEQTNVALNVATLVGHNDVRRKAMGGSFSAASALQASETPHNKMCARRTTAVMEIIS